MREILCFGDSNTWGADPSAKGGNPMRFPNDVRWTGVLQAALGNGYRVIEEGLNGRTSVWEDPVEGDKMGKRHLVPTLESQAPLDLVILMLGTNDTKKRYSASAMDIQWGMDKLLDIISKCPYGRDGKAPPVLLVAPVPLGKLGEYAPLFEGGTEKSRALAPLYADLARARGYPFFDAGTVVKCSDADGVHFEAPGHKALGEALAREVKKFFKA